jgi:hypothetical protein
MIHARVSGGPVGQRAERHVAVLTSVGEKVGVAVGSRVGAAEGGGVGSRVGVAVGTAVGCAVGDCDVSTAPTTRHVSRRSRKRRLLAASPPWGTASGRRSGWPWEHRSRPWGRA